MKATKFYTVLGLAILFATATIAGNINEKKTGTSVEKLIRYRVNIHMEVEKSICNLYLVKIVDAFDRELAPAKAYVPGISSYDFFERGPAEGIRIARLVKYNYGGHFECLTELFTAPAVLSGKFMNGETYRFDLFPTLEPPRE